jgi:hypothetical protein
MMGYFWVLHLVPQEVTPAAKSTHGKRPWKKSNVNRYRVFRGSHWDISRRYSNNVEWVPSWRAEQRSFV